MCGIKFPSLAHLIDVNPCAWGVCKKFKYDTTMDYCSFCGSSFHRKCDSGGRYNCEYTNLYTFPLFIIYILIITIFSFLLFRYNHDPRNKKIDSATGVEEYKCGFCDGLQPVTNKKISTKHCGLCKKNDSKNHLLVICCLCKNVWSHVACIKRVGVTKSRYVCEICENELSRDLETKIFNENEPWVRNYCKKLTLNPTQ